MPVARAGAPLAADLLVVRYCIALAAVVVGAVVAVAGVYVVVPVGFAVRSAGLLAYYQASASHLLQSQ